jgi:hypothetical protein
MASLLRPASRFRTPPGGIKDPSIPFVHVDKEVMIEIAAKGTLKAQQLKAQ